MSEQQTEYGFWACFYCANQHHISTEPCSCACHEGESRTNANANLEYRRMLARARAAQPVTPPVDPVTRDEALGAC